VRGNRDPVEWWSESRCGLRAADDAGEFELVGPADGRCTATPESAEADDRDAPA
jgi:hypothetical protein